MILRWVVHPNAYRDSLELMRVSDLLLQQPGIIRAAAVMATPLNIQLLEADDLFPPGAAAHPEDLLIAVRGADDDAAEAALLQADEFLRGGRPAGGQDAAYQTSPLVSLDDAVRAGRPNVAVIAVPGPYAAAEAFAALHAGLHVFLFSDNVSIRNEVLLKQLAEERNLLMMGPDCGTAILSGVGLGFANCVAAGPVGIVGASGTGIQQVCCLLDAAGIGIAQAIGTGGRDLWAEVGGVMTRRALRMMDADESISIIALISKATDPATSSRLQEEIRSLSKPVVACLLGERPADTAGVQYTSDLTEAAQLILAHVQGTVPPVESPPSVRSKGVPRAGRVYGFYTGGTLCSETQRILHAMGVPHELLDLGADRFTEGRAHPIIDPRLRTSMLADLPGRSDVGAVIVDVILGNLAHPNPAAAVVNAIRGWRERPPVLAVLVGTRNDPQGLDEQRAILHRARIQVFTSNADAARAAGRLTKAAG